MKKNEIRLARARLIISELGSAAEFASIMGMSDSQVSQIAGENPTRGIGNIIADRIEKTCKKPPGWLDMVSDIEIKTNQSAFAGTEICRSDEVVIDQHHDVSGSMGAGLLLRDLPGQITGWRVTSEWANKNIPSNTGKQNLCIVTGFGDSMRGMFNSGDPLLVDTGVRELNFDGVYFFRIGTEGFIKRLQRIPGDGIRAISKNTDYEAWTVTPEMDFEIFGRVVKVWKSEDL